VKNVADSVRAIVPCHITLNLQV